jgi:hypothetical protein
VINRSLTVEQELNQQNITFDKMIIRVKVKQISNLKSDRNITLMVFFQCLLYTFGKIKYIKILNILLIFFLIKRNDSIFDSVYIKFCV